MLASSNGAGNSQPNNAILSDPSYGNYTITVPGIHYCGNAIQPFFLDDTLGMTAGRYVLLRSLGGIDQYAGATVTLSGTWTLSVYSISREKVSYSGTTYDCIVVTLV